MLTFYMEVKLQNDMEGSLMQRCGLVASYHLEILLGQGLEIVLTRSAYY